MVFKKTFFPPAGDAPSLLGGEKKEIFRRFVFDFLRKALPVTNHDRRLRLAGFFKEKVFKDSLEIKK
jgi:hypothetical protein